MAAAQQLIDYLRGLGTAEIDHTGHDFLRHLIAVHDLLAAHGVDEELAVAGLFHSIYGTERFQDFCLPLSERDRIRQLIGSRAERLAWLNCVMDRASFDHAVSAALEGESEPAKLTISDRDGVQISVDANDLRDLATVHLFDWLEQVERSEFGWGYRRQAYQEMAALSGPAAEALYADIFSREPQKSSGAAVGP